MRGRELPGSGWWLFQAVVFLLLPSASLCYFFLCFSFSLSTKFLPFLYQLCGLPPVRSGSQWLGRGTTLAAMFFFFFFLECVASINNVLLSLPWLCCLSHVCGVAAIAHHPHQVCSMSIHFSKYGETRNSCLLLVKKNEWESPPSFWLLGTRTGLRDQVHRLIA